MLIYVLSAIAAGLWLAALIYAARVIRRRRDERETARRLEGWAKGDGPQRAALRVIDGNRR